MSLIGMKLADIVPPDARVVRTESTEIQDRDGNPTGEKIVMEELDLNGDDVAEFRRNSIMDAKGNLRDSMYSVFSGNPVDRFDAFADENSDGVIDNQYLLNVSYTPEGQPWTYEGISVIDRNFDGRPDRRARMGANGETLWVLEDRDFDGDYDVETKWTRLPSREDPKGSKTIREVNIDVSSFE